MQGIVYNSFYCSLKQPNVVASNLAHLRYIMLKFQEVTFNKGCDFSLWGKFPDTACGDINDYDYAIKTMAEVSQRRTVYRGVLSLDDETADYKNMNDRAAWQELTEKRMDIIAKEYGIKPENFCWAGSFHFKAEHPHTHIMFWDNSDDVQEEFIPKPRFEVLTDKIRESFNKDIFADELHKLYKEQDALKSDFKQQFKQMLTAVGSSVKEDADIKEELHLLFDDALLEGKVDNNLDTMSLNTDNLHMLGQRILLISDSLPKQGSLDYKYLPQEIKSEINAAIDAFLEITPGYRFKYEALLNTADEISKLYGNKLKGKEHHREGLKYKFYTDLANISLKWLTTNKDVIDNTSKRLTGLHSYVAIKNTVATKVNEMVQKEPEIILIKPKAVVYKEDLHLRKGEEQYITVLGADEPDEEPREKPADKMIIKTNEVRKLFDAFPSKGTSLKKLFADKAFTKLFDNAVKELMQLQEVKAAVADYCITDRIEYRQRLLKDLTIVLPDKYSDDELDERATEQLQSETQEHFDTIEKDKVLHYCKKTFTDLDEAQLAEKADEIIQNKDKQFDTEREKIGVPIKRTEYFKQKTDAYKLVRSTLLQELKDINQYDKQYADSKAAWQQRQEEWQHRHEQYEKEVAANLAVQLVVNLSRLFKSDNWQHYKNSVLGKDKSLFDRKNIRAKLRQKSTFEWRDELER